MPGKEANNNNQANNNNKISEFSKSLFNTEDSFPNTIATLKGVFNSILAGMKDQETVSPWSTLAAFFKDAVSFSETHLDELGWTIFGNKEFDKFNYAYTSAMNYIDSVMKKKAGSLSPLELRLRNIVESDDQMEYRLNYIKQHMSAFINGMESAEKYAKETADAKTNNNIEEYTRQALTKKRPTIHECLTAEAESTDLKVIFKNMFWLTERAGCRDYILDNMKEAKKAKISVPDFPKHDVSLYGYSYRKRADEIGALSIDKQINFIQYMQRSITKAGIAAEKEYNEILNKIPKDFKLSASEVRLLAAKKILNQPGCSEIKNAIDNNPDLKNKEDKDAYILSHMNEWPNHDEMLITESREFYAKVQLQSTKIFHDCITLSTIQSACIDGIGARSQSVKIVTSNMDGFENLCPDLIKDLISSGRSDYIDKCKRSESPEMQKIWKSHLSKEISAAKKIMFAADYGSIQKNLLGMSETYLNILKDDRRASSDFTKLRASLKSVFSVDLSELENTDMLLNFYKDTVKAQKRLTSYLRSKHYPERIDAAKVMKTGIDELIPMVVHQIRESRALTAAKALKNELQAVKDGAADIHSVENANKIKEAYATIVVSMIRTDFVPGSNDENTFIQNFVNSHAATTMFRNHTKDQLLSLADTFTKTHRKNAHHDEIDGELKVLNTLIHNNAEEYLSHAPKKKNLKKIFKKHDQVNAGPANKIPTV